MDSILVVDDEADLVRTYERLLRRRGFRVVSLRWSRRRWEGEKRCEFAPSVPRPRRGVARWGVSSPAPVTFSRPDTPGTWCIQSRFALRPTWHACCRACGLHRIPERAGTHGGARGRGGRAHRSGRHGRARVVAARGALAAAPARDSPTQRSSTAAFPVRDGPAEGRGGVRGAGCPRHCLHSAFRRSWSPPLTVGGRQ
jgi:hypothetical protein